MRMKRKKLSSSMVGGITMAIALLVTVRLRANATDGRFVTVADGVQDMVTGLVWQQTDDATTYTWDLAVAHCVAPWRLPTVDELFTLTDVRATTSPTLDTIFGRTGTTYTYWSATQVSGTGGSD